VTAPTFKIGDRVRCGAHVGTIDKVAEFSSWFRINGADSWGKWTRWVDPLQCVPCPPMSPQARMLWHAMRAGAKRTNGRVFVFGNLRKREYSDAGNVFLTIYGDYQAVQS
jgi:hypothetical protein